MLNLFDANFITLLTKISFLIVGLLFTLFLFVVFRQVSSMNHVVHDSHDSIILNTVALGLAFFGLSLFLIAVVIL